MRHVRGVSFSLFAAGLVACSALWSGDLDGELWAWLSGLGLGSGLASMTDDLRLAGERAKLRFLRRAAEDAAHGGRSDG